MLVTSTITNHKTPPKTLEPFRRSAHFQMTIMRIISRLILRKSSPFSPPRWFSTSAEATATAQPGKRNLLFYEVVRKSSNSSIADILNRWVDGGEQVKKCDIFNLSKYFRTRKNFRAALQLYDWMDSSKLESSNADQAIRIDLLSKTEGVASAEKYFNSLKQLEKTNKTYGALLSCYCRERLLDKALGIFDKMKVLNYTSTLNYNNVLSLFNNTDQPEEVISLVQEMEEKNIAPDLYTYNLLINSYAALKNLDAMEGVMEKIESSNMKPDLFTHGNLATIYFDSGLPEKANAFLRLMEEMEIQHDEGAVEACRTRMKLYSMMSDLSGVNRAWEALKSVSPNPSNTSYLLMLLALSKLGDKENLEKIFKEWEEGCSLYDFRLPNVLLEYYLSQDMIEEATSLYKTLENGRSEPNLKALNLFADLCIKNCQIDLALKYLEMGLDKAKTLNSKWFPNDETVKLFLYYFEENNDRDSAEKFAESMKKHNRLDSNYLLLNIKAPDAGS